MQSNTRVDHKLMAIKSAVNTKELSIDEANELILSQKVLENQEMLKEILNSDKNFKSICRHVKLNQYMKKQRKNSVGSIPRLKGLSSLKNERSSMGEESRRKLANPVLKNCETGQSTMNRSSHQIFNEERSTDQR
mmetsp:Transcript_22568/g.21737  ORF Transcript_22568/g.21737 Transcript_22568/m.21737 type:complete len:135 (-) Transcript_22568:2058-2462(-)